MASSFVEFQRYGFWSTDNGLDVWQNFLRAAIEKMPDKPAWLSDFQEHLREQMYMAGSGAMDPGLDDFVTDEDRKDLLIRLVKQTIARIESYGGTIATDELLEMGLGIGNSYVKWWVATTTTDRYINIGNAYLRLLLGEIKTDAATSPVMDGQKS